jgi:CubicO group peptidase (beta-lactamase class C family)
MSGNNFPRSAPSALGVDARGVLAFLDAVEAKGLDFHSLMLLRRGHVLAEGWWAPYRADLPHLLYSLSKSFTSTAIGIAQYEGLLSVDDYVVSFFPEKVPKDALAHVREMKVCHLLAMASGHASDTWPNLSACQGDIVAAFLSTPPEHAPGTFFCYNQGCTYTLSAIITKVSGQRLVDYLQPRLLGPLGIREANWVQTKDGIDQGFSGLHVVTESVAKLGQLYLQHGRWQGRQLVPQKFVAEATSKQVATTHHPEGRDWRHGYGYQFWVCRHGAYRGDGAFGQFCVVVPEAQAVMVCTAQVSEMQDQLNLFWEHLLPALSGQGPSGSRADQDLAERLGQLSAPLVASCASTSPLADTVTVPSSEALDPYVAGVTEARLEPAGAGTVLGVVVNGTEHRFDLQTGRWAEGQLPGLRLHRQQVAISGAWTAADDFRADIVSVTSPHRLQLRFELGDSPAVEGQWSTQPL